MIAYEFVSFQFSVFREEEEVEEEKESESLECCHEGGFGFWVGVEGEELGIAGADECDGGVF